MNPLRGVVLINRTSNRRSGLMVCPIANKQVPPAMPDFLDIGPGNGTRNNWRSFVVAMSHEIGHFLTLPHFCSQVGDDPTGTETGAVCSAADGNQIMHPIVGANRSLYNDNEISKSRSRADGYEVTI